MSAEVPRCSECGALFELDGETMRICENSCTFKRDSPDAPWYLTSALKVQPSPVVAAPPPSPSGLPTAPRRFPPLTDLGNAERLVAQHGADLRYCPQWGAWLVWDEARFARDATGEVERRAKATVRAIYRETEEAADSDRKAIGLWAVRSESEARIRAMIALAQSEAGIPVTPEQLDADPWLLNVQNGTIELRTGRMREHRREDHITKLARVNYDPKATAPTFDAFLERVQPDPETRSYLQRCAGYAATGETMEQSVFLHCGGGANGKSTFSRGQLDAMGDYGKQAAPDLLTLGRDSHHPTEIADLAGVRLAVSIEIEAGKRLAEVLVKQMTGGDRLKARFMHRDFFEFQPTHKVFIAANHKPIIRGTDHAIWRRIRLIPWEVTITEAEQDKRLPDKLRAELPGILRWIVEGCLAWQRDGLSAPEVVSSATAGYRASMDVLGDFLNERTLSCEGASVTAKVLYDAYAAWCAQGGEKPLPKNRFGEHLAERGFCPGRAGKKQQRVWLGLALDIEADGQTKTDADTGLTPTKGDSIGKPADASGLSVSAFVGKEAEVNLDEIPF